MKKFVLFSVFIPSFLWSTPYFPECELGELFQDVQLKRVFSDSKTFVDSDPLCPPQEIVNIYRSHPPDDLKAFVETYFELPEFCGQPPLKGLEMEEYIIKTWDVLLCSTEDARDKITSLIALPCSYVVAGGRFREIYYWDSFFSMLGLALSDRWDLLEGMIDDFAYLIDTYGFIPNGNRTYFLTRSQPPFFSLMVRLYICRHGKEAAAERYLDRLEKEYCFWMTKRLSSNGLLNYYSDACCTPRPEGYFEDVTHAEKLPPDQRAMYYRNVRAVAESGWDFSSRWLDEEKEVVTTDILPVDLNSLLYHEEKLLGELYAMRGCEEKASYYWERAAARRKAMDQYFWNEEKGFYFDYNSKKEKQTEHFTLAAAFPLLFSLSSQHQAEAVAKKLKEEFLYSGGLVTTLTESGQQWDFPNGWAPLQWVAVQGLRNYENDALASDIAQRWIKANEEVYAETNLMLEKYNVVEVGLLAEGGEYAVQAGFGWTNGVALYFLKCLDIMNSVENSTDQSGSFSHQLRVQAR